MLFARAAFAGRPWNDLATTVYLRTFMDATVEPVGWTPFDSARPVIMNTTFYAEFDSTGTHTVCSAYGAGLTCTFMVCLGPGGNTSQRIPLEHLLTVQEANDFTVDKVFLEPPQWIDRAYRF